MHCLGYKIIKQLLIKKCENKNGIMFSLLFSHTQYGDLFLIKKHGISENGFKKTTVYKSIYFDDSLKNNELFKINYEKAIEWFDKIINI